MFVKKINTNFLFNYLFIQVLVHIVYRVTFLDQVEEHFNISKNLFSETGSLTQFFIESPLLLILGNVLNIETLDRYLIITYLFAQIFILLICLELDFLGDYSSLFLIISPNRFQNSKQAVNRQPDYRLEDSWIYFLFTF